MPGLNTTIGSTGQVSSRNLGYPTLYLNDLETIWTSVTTVTVGPGQCKDSTDIKNIIVPANILCNIAVNGANGLDVGAAAANTWYYLFVIADIQDSVPVATLLSLSSTAPTLPANYNVFRRVGVLRMNTNTQFYKFAQSWANREKLYVWDEEVAFGANDFIVLYSGAAIVFTNVSVATSCPPTANCVKLLYSAYFNGLAGKSYSWIRPFGATATAPVFQAYGWGRCTDEIIFWCPVDQNSIVQYMLNRSVDTPYMIVTGFIDDLG